MNLDSTKIRFITSSPWGFVQQWEWTSKITFQKKGNNPALVAAFISVDFYGSYYNILCSIFLTLIGMSYESKKNAYL